MDILEADEQGFCLSDEQQKEWIKKNYETLYKNGCGYLKHNVRVWRTIEVLQQEKRAEMERLHKEMRDAKI